jgi:FAD synthase
MLQKNASSFTLDFLDDLRGHKIEIVLKRFQRERNKFKNK